MSAPASNGQSNIRLVVQWDEGPIYAGEELKCTLTFTNVAAPPTRPHARNISTATNGSASSSSRVAPSRSKTLKNSSGRHASSGEHASSTSVPRGHRQAMSLSVPPPGGFGQSDRGAQLVPVNSTDSAGHRHQRSVSIVSLGGGDAGRGSITNHAGPPRTGERPGRRHARSASLQIVPKRGGASNGRLISPGTSSGPLSQILPADIQGWIQGPRSALPRPSMVGQLHSPPLNTSVEYPLRTRPLPGSRTAPSTPGPALGLRNPLATQLQQFRFPPETPVGPINDTAAGAPNESVQPTIALPSPSPETRLEASETSNGFGGPPSPIKALSGSSVNGHTPRSSGDFFSLSNHSTETFVSEYVSPLHHRSRVGSSLLRRASTAAQGATVRRQQPESLMMGSVQVAGSFTLDGSLVNQAPFEEVKRKGVIGGQGGGGVVGVGSKSNSGLFGSFGWGQIGESLGGLLGSGELSSLKEMRGTANAQDIPLLRTPPSVLFVDLRLAPGESRAYRYRFPLPKGLPPTHRGRAIRISYHLVVGTQRAASAQQPQHVRHVEIPFRVFGGVNDQGELLGHDLLSPRLLLTDQARTASIDGRTHQHGASQAADPPSSTSSSTRDFRTFVESLLAQSSDQNHQRPSLLSPTESSSRGRQPSVVEQRPDSVKEAIDLAVLRSNVLPSGSRRANRFEIARNGQRVATVTLIRTAYRLGEMVMAAVDLARADVACYAMRATLETTETVDGRIALRSSSSVQRATRRRHASQSESTLFAQRVLCTLGIPLSATPGFITTGVSLNWSLRVEFVTPRLTAGPSPGPRGIGEDDGDDGNDDDEDDDDEKAALPPLLEELTRDERGSVWAAVEHLPCETFDVAIPLRVYGPVSDEVHLETTSTREGWAV
ncbi:MAG: hypothetical protein M1823_003102 [Watsoniomyces obsoletus]|nr:MAG: hypothetical protein M1823_003102 [Watsoniomyces obsoletus]